MYYCSYAQQFETIPSDFFSFTNPLKFGEILCTSKGSVLVAQSMGISEIDRMQIEIVTATGPMVDDKGNKTAKAGTVATAFTFGKEGITVSSVNSKGNGVRGWVSYDGLSTGDQNTDKKIATLHSLVQNDMKSFILMSKLRFGIDLRVTDGFRTVAQQDKLYAQGRTTKGSIVTKARGGFSNHNFGLAVDVVPFENGKLNWNTKYYPLIGLIGVTHARQ